MRTLFEILSMNERVIVWSSEEDNTIWTWNQASTLQRWYYNPTEHSWYEVDIRTLENQPSSFEQAKKKAVDWYLGN